MHNSTFTHRWFIAVGILCLQLSTAIWTSDALAADSDREQDDPPDRVARLSYTQGHVALQIVDSDDWIDSSLNRPLTSGDRLRLDRNAKAELQTGPLDLQLDQGTEFSFLELTDDVAQARLTAGALYLSVRRLRDNEVVEVDTPQAAVAISKPGEYSISIAADGESTLVKTYNGAAEVTDHRQTVRIESRQQANFSGPARDVAAAVETLDPRSSFDSWAHDRNQRRERSASSRYVDPDVIGYSDLDDHGDWIREADYGYVWYPTHVAVDWSPYRYGRWTWVSPWGWTWVDDAPWGFAPFHYGRWAHVRGRWCWVPGPLHVRPVYAPALVAWVGAGPPRTHVSVSIAFGAGIGWFPLAPREIFVPSYRCSRRHIHNVNYSNTVVINNIYINRAYNNRATHFDHVNRNVRDAVTVVHSDAFAASRPVREHRVHVNERELRGWETRNATPAINPQRVSAQLAWNPSSARGLDRNREVVMRRTPSEHRIAPDRTQLERGNRNTTVTSNQMTANQAPSTSLAARQERRDDSRSSRRERTFENSGRQSAPVATTPGGSVGESATASHRREVSGGDRGQARAQNPDQSAVQNPTQERQREPSRPREETRADSSRFQNRFPTSQPRDYERPQQRGGDEGAQRQRQHSVEPRMRESAPQPSPRPSSESRGHEQRGQEGRQPRQRFNER